MIRHNDPYASFALERSQSPTFPMFGVERHVGLVIIEDRAGDRIKFQWSAEQRADIAQQHQLHGRAGVIEVG